MNKKFLEIFNVAKRYGNAVIVTEFTVSLAPGEFVSLIGHSGCGKSTVLSMVAGLTKSDDGGIVLDGREIDGPGTDRGVVFQAPCLFPWMTARQNVMLGVEAKFPSKSLKERADIVDHYLDLVGLEDSKEKRSAELSAGMRQRVGLARAFALSPKLLLLDEPFGMLDSLTRLELQDVLLELLQRDGKTALMVTHDVDEALYLSDRVVMMTSGPAARVGGILSVPFPKPRQRAAVLEHDDYYVLREQLIGFLEEQGHGHAPPAPALLLQTLAGADHDHPDDQVLA
ncbi:MAG TPA: ABC transporter ATP-binding protein [Polyangiaceae bacterium]|nr:ABC transporter ATP-binding protein [Polyangiaceae bacterium]